MNTETKAVLGMRGEEVLLGDATGAVQAYSFESFDFPPVFGDKVAVISFDNGSVRVIRQGGSSTLGAPQSAAVPPAAPPVQEAPPPVMDNAHNAAQASPPPSAKRRSMLGKGLAILLALGVLAAAGWRIASGSYGDYETKSQLSEGPGEVGLHEHEDGDYEAKSQLSEVYAVASKLKTAVAECFVLYEKFPDSNEEAGERTQTGQYATATITEGGVIEVEMLPSADRKIRGGRMLFIPKHGENQNIEWSCESSGIPQNLVLSGCR